MSLHTQLRFSLEKLEERLAPLLSTSVDVSSHESTPDVFVDPDPVTADPDPVTVSNTTVDVGPTTLDPDRTGVGSMELTNIDEHQEVNV